MIGRCPGAVPVVSLGGRACVRHTGGAPGTDASIATTGLAFLVAADVIRSFASAPQPPWVDVVGLIVLVRTSLGWSLELEVNGT
jgi:Protein of unknown function (DUF1622)